MSQPFCGHGVANHDPISRRHCIAAMSRETTLAYTIVGAGLRPARRREHEPSPVRSGSSHYRIDARRPTLDSRRRSEPSQGPPFRWAAIIYFRRHPRGEQTMFAEGSPASLRGGEFSAHRYLADSPALTPRPCR